MGKRTFFRAWFYFRTGWGTYFAFILAAINTLTVTYYLAIEKAPFLKEIFPSFLFYVFVITLSGIPLLTLIGYIHYKKSGAVRAEMDVGIEANPHVYRLLLNVEIILELNLRISRILLKISKNEKLTDDEINEIVELNKKLSDHMKNKTIDNLRRVSNF